MNGTGRPHDSSTSPVLAEWIVVIEVLAAMPPDQGDMQRLLAELAEFDPIGLISAERYALQARVLDGSPEQALTAVMAAWRRAAEGLLLGPATVLRTEVMTRRELEHDIDAAMEDHDDGATTSSLHREPIVRPDRVVPEVLSVLAGSDPEEVARAAGVNFLQLLRWCDLFVEGGRLRLEGMLASADERDHRFFDLLARECRRVLGDGSPGSRDSHRASGADEANGASAPLISPIDGLRGYVDVLTEAVAASRRELPLRLAEVDVTALVGEVLSSVGGAVRMAPVPPVALVTDADVLRRAVRQLVSAALGSSSGRAVDVSVRSRPGSVTVEVGVPTPSPGRQALRTLFEPFGDGTTELGLFPCRALVVALGGKVGVGEGGEKITFWLWVPCHSAPDEPREHAGRHTIECGDVLPGCPVAVEADTVEELLGNPVNYGRQGQGLGEPPPLEWEGRGRDGACEEEG